MSPSTDITCLGIELLKVTGMGAGVSVCVGVPYLEVAFFNMQNRVFVKQIFSTAVIFFAKSNITFLEKVRP